MSGNQHQQHFQDHPITTASFAVIDQEIDPAVRQRFSPQGYAIVRRVIHATADFEYGNLLQVSDGAAERAIAALQRGAAVVTDVGMVAQGIYRVARQTLATQVTVAVDQAERALPGKTRTETGLLACCSAYPTAVYVIGNAPTALLALCDQVDRGAVTPALVVGVPVGFINVIEAKQRLAATAVPHILTSGRKGGSGVAAAIANALLILASHG